MKKLFNLKMSMIMFIAAGLTFASCGDGNSNSNNNNGNTGQSKSETSPEIIKTNRFIKDNTFEGLIYSEQYYISIRQIREKLTFTPKSEQTGTVLAVRYYQENSAATGTTTKETDRVTYEYIISDEGVISFANHIWEISGTSLKSSLIDINGNYIYYRKINTYTNNQSTASTQNSATENSNQVKSTTNSYFATSKIFFYSEPYESAITKKWLAEGDVSLIQQVQNGFGYTVFINEKGVKTKGWLKMSELKINTVCGEWEIKQGDEFGFPILKLEEDGTATYQTSDDYVYCGTYDFNGNNVIFTGKPCGDNASESSGRYEKFTFNVRGNNLIDSNGDAYIRSTK